MKLNLLMGFLLLATAARAELSAIESAQKLLLKNQRSAAMDLLTAAIRKESVTKNRLKLRKALEMTAQEFLTDKGQKLFQLGLSLERANPAVAVQRFSEALAEEDFNLPILTARSRAQVAQRRCLEAKQDIDQGLRLDPFNVGLLELHVRAQLCLGEREQARAEIVALQDDLPPWRRAWLKELSLQGETAVSGLAAGFDQIRKDAPDFPETYYFLWKLEKPSGAAKPDLGKRYVSLCKSLSQRSHQDYVFEPFLCSRVDEVQAELERQRKTNEEDFEK